MRALGPILAAIAFSFPQVIVAAISSAPPADPAHSCLMVLSNAHMRNGAKASGNGTGFLVDGDLLLTCNHLLRIPTPVGIVSAQQLTVQTGPKEFTPATVVAKDVEHDLALLKLQRPVVGCSALQVQPCALQPRDAVKIIGNFADRVRTSRGKLIHPHTMDGFALSSAKVYSGFSGGPILDENGKVQGILSQRDDNNNAIFVRSEVFMKFLAGYASRAGRTIACLQEPVENLDARVTPSGAAENEVVIQQRNSRTLHEQKVAADTADKQKAPVRPLIFARTKRQKITDSEVVVAIPVRKSATHYTSGITR
ncbi:MAG: S1 family peptidase [Candidatus Sumerlaeaceae bacterium]